MGVPTNSCGEIAFDELFRQLIVGSWVQVSDVYAVSEFSASMWYEANIYRSEQKEDLLGHLEGVWQVEGGQLKVKLSKSSLPQLPVGIFISEQINLLDGRRLVLTDVNDERYMKLRLRQDAVSWLKLHIQ